MFGKKEDSRFKVVVKDHVEERAYLTVYVDTETGVQYLFAQHGLDIGGMSVLMDKDGKPKIDETYIKKEQ